jgi:hypothetical protein
MSTSDLLGCKGRPVRKADNPTANCLVKINYICGHANKKFWMPSRKCGNLDASQLYEPTGSIRGLVLYLVSIKLIYNLKIAIFAATPPINRRTEFSLCIILVYFTSVSFVSDVSKCYESYKRLNSVYGKVIVREQRNVYCQRRRLWAC